ncbi:MAG: phosphate ABC transporter permease [Candidatus Zambryskibacteria bacterium RIFCSPLOWO2_12_FULL_39_45]|uniref:Transport permease protein n=3 Tax=Candidatus Zambryskiibacteriota TaxID=1817925 RepID=A0A1G2T7A0_9BACT|nr:MAG: phosphate ABC transporter permease [Candidatus Zambryskibacteria bacterium RIFCSPHIGHO2_02_38_10.5]OHA95226.1 MAG: phosphate ABC transporter permease [Candidatus Zambryskibacteria bacterium RIFCSPHIGHO2_02_FULL_39_82]OHA97484.1 MAG: phosphate ABC transporter permease [Candidatus Zambryskibacteria bacterium RIFCSPHIGHO2_12_FULL_38_37]OHB09598.1 MAG: phosphate ABC transporter permease [Candidatus Zambryskibacteria bacterium RIFCSPLOWO2_02_FULL_39_69]OHB13029.1 MAG: phosphate ABC transport
MNQSAFVKETVIRPKKTFSLEDVREVWRYKELLYFFVWRDLKVRYKQTSIGVLWALIQPFVTMVVFSIFFGGLAKMPSDGVPYPIFVYVGLLFWNFFSSALGDTSNTLLANQSIITKVYFPRLILPIASVATKLIDFSIGTIMLVILMFYYGYIPHLGGLFILPLLLLITFMTSVGLGLFLCSINIKYRDVRYALPFLMQIMLYVTPVIYPASIAGKYSWVLAINPMMGVIQNARAAVLGTTPINWLLISISLVGTLVLMIFGIYFFKKTERYFADIV